MEESKSINLILGAHMSNAPQPKSMQSCLEKATTHYKTKLKEEKAPASPAKESIPKSANQV